MLSNRPQTHPSNQPPTAMATTESMIARNESNGASVAYLHTSIGPSGLIDKMSNLINETAPMFFQFFNKEGDLYQTLVKLDQARAKLLLQEFLDSEPWKEKIVQWSELGVYYRSSEAAPPLKNRVSILIKKDEQGLPYYLSVLLNSSMCDASFYCNLDDFKHERDRILEHKLTYVNDWTSIIAEKNAIAEQLHRSNNATRTELMNGFNQKWQGQLEITYTLTPQTRYGKAKLIDRTGKVLSESGTNYAFVDRAVPASNVPTGALLGFQYPNAAANSAPARNGTDRYDLRKIAQKRPYPL